MKAFMVREPDEGNSMIVFAETRGQAKMKAFASEELGYHDYIELEAVRKPKFDQYSGQGYVPPQALLDDGWWFWCDKCGEEHITKEDGARVIDGQVYCAKCAREMMPDKPMFVDDWICYWCGAVNRRTLGLNTDMGSDYAECEKCGKNNLVLFSIEYVLY